MNVKVENLRALCQSILTDRGLDVADAHIVTDILIEAELRGRPTHGMIRLPGIAERVSQGTQLPMVVEKDAPAYTLIDGRDNLGYLVAHRCACAAIDKAEQSGDRRCGCARHEPQWDAGILRLYDSRCGPDRTGYVQHRPRALSPGEGSSPYSGQIPSQRDSPQQKARYWSIFRAPAITNGEILMALKDGKEIPAGRALGPDGKPTTDPRASPHGWRIALWRTQRIRSECHDPNLFRRIAQCCTRT